MKRQKKQETEERLEEFLSLYMEMVFWIMLFVLKMELKNSGILRMDMMSLSWERIVNFHYEELLNT